MDRQSTALGQSEKDAASVKVLPFGELLDRIQRLSSYFVNRAFQLFQTRGRAFGRDLDDWLRAESEFVRPIHIDLSESPDALTVRAEVQGFSANELEVGVESHRLTICGKREPSEQRPSEKTIYGGLGSNQIYRAINLPADIVTSKATATLKNGLLMLTMPKAARVQKMPAQENPN